MTATTATTVDVTIPAALGPDWAPYVEGYEAGFLVGLRRGWQFARVEEDAAGRRLAQHVREVAADTPHTTLERLRRYRDVDPATTRMPTPAECLASWSDQEVGVLHDQELGAEEHLLRGAEDHLLGGAA